MTNRRLISCFVISLLVLSALTVACFGSARDNTLVIAQPSDPVSLDANQETTAMGAWTYMQINEPLIQLNSQMEMEPCLATSWEFINETTLRFYLREGVTFHDGTPFNAQAVKFTWNRALFEEPRANWVSMGADPITDIRVIDDYTVDFIMNAPYGAILNTMSMYTTGVVSPAAVEKYGDEYGRHPVGTGPFIFKEWKTRNYIRLVANENYWQGRPALDAVLFRIIPEEGSRMIALRAGDVDVVLKPAPAELSSFDADPNFNVISTQGMRVFYLGFNLSNWPLGDIRVRHAIAHAINRESIVENILEGAGSLAGLSFFAPSVFGYYAWETDQLYPYDPDKALVLLAEAGFSDEDGDGFLEKNGRELVLRFLPANGRYVKDREVAEAIEAQLREIGIRVEMDIFEWATTFGKWRSADLPYEMISAGWGGLTDCDYSLWCQFLSDMTPPTGWNSYRYSNLELDRLIKLGRITLDQEERKLIYARVQSLLAADLPFVPIFVTKETAVISTDVKGLVMYPSEYYLDLFAVHY